MYSVRRPGKLAFCDAGPKSRNTRLSRTVIIYAQYKMAPLAKTLFVLLSFAPREPRAYSDRYIQYASYVHYITAYPAIMRGPIFRKLPKFPGPPKLKPRTPSLGLINGINSLVPMMCSFIPNVCWSQRPIHSVPVIRYSQSNRSSIMLVPNPENPSKVPGHLP